MTQIPLWVDETQGCDIESFPLMRGIPLVRGVLSDPKLVSLLDESGKPLACVARPVAFWPDKSIKWLLLDFQSALKAGKVSKLKLVVGEKPGALPVRPLTVSESPDAVSVDTGKIKLTLARSADQPSLSISMGEDTVVKSAGQWLTCLFSHVKDPERYRSGVWTDDGEADPGIVQVTDLRIEERSPLRAVILLRANLKHKLLASTIDAKNRPPAGTPVSVRFHLYANSPLVRIQHTFMLTGDVRYDYLRELGVCLPLPPSPNQKVRVGLDGATVMLDRATMGLLQEDPDSAVVWRGTEQHYPRPFCRWLARCFQRPLRRHRRPARHARDVPPGDPGR